MDDLRETARLAWFVLSKDILTVPEEQIPSAEVLSTIVRGKVKYRRPDL